MGKLEAIVAEIDGPEVDPDADFSLPGWIYHDREFFDLEMERVIRPSWQIVCHVNEIPNPGDYQTIDYLGESVVVIRGDDGAVRAFTNVCRHRAMRLVEGPMGCAKKLVCPYHAWAYETDGRLSGVPMKSEYPALKLEENGLVPVATEVWHGFVFVNLAPGGFPTVNEMMAPFEGEVSHYRFEDMERMAPVRLRPRGVNWKNVGDNYSDNLHIPVAHDGLTRLVGKTYRIEAHGWADRLYGDVVKNEKQLLGALLPHPSAARGSFAARGPWALALLQAVAEHGLRHLRRPDRFHAVAANQPDRMPAARSGLCPARQPP